MVNTKSAPSDQDILTSLVEGKESVLQIPVDILDTENEFVIVAQLPGIAVDNIDISVSGEVGVVVIEGVRNPPLSYTNTLTQECSWGAVYRRLLLPEAVASDNVNANLANGVLTLRLEKANQEISSNNTYDDSF